ncbi:MAG: nitroreductase [Bacteroidia bacterium]|nr:nitroreductase [Bacteroidia bacterium]NNF31713.1 nitroreductase [Flavobacteriaceae bacterium]NNJ81126.1 nitroreductase [Flavobacteriaceae bacterium]NNK55227.1 nitroreductase [Flavobacteriaceae bacterium]NNM10222.1 nitroreductase [Flavobacteriaceae bacterium]
MLEVIKARRAVFPAQYNSEVISKEEIQTILEAANWAPTHRRTEPWRFKVFYGESQHMLGEFLAQKYKATSEKYSEFKFRKILDKTKQSGCIIAICMQRDPLESVPEWEEIASTAMAVQNMWLMAQSMQIGAYWSTPAYKQYFGEHVPLADGERCLGFFFMGKINGELQEGERKTQIADKTIWL